MNLNEMRELKNIVNHLCDNPDLLDNCVKMANYDLEIKIHNARISAIHGNTNDCNITDAKCAMYIHDLLLAIKLYMEDENDATITIDNSMYPNATL